MKAEYSHRTALLFGQKGIQRLQDTRVIVFGVGGVGSWCAECLVRSGIGHITIVDSDNIAASNINRQLMATSTTIGKAKVEVLKDRLLDINPELSITALQSLYTPENAESFSLDTYNYVIDAIDSLDSKAHLIRHACSSDTRLFSSMGAALKIDVSHIHTAEFWNVKGCPLARALRNKFKKSKLFPSRKFYCVYSDELIENKNIIDQSDILNPDFKKVAINGSLAHITMTFGSMLASLVIKDIYSRGND